MSNLTKYTLSKDRKKNDWVLTNDATGSVKKRFATKEKALRGGVLKRLLGKAGGSVKIRKEDGRYQEERTFPRSKDPIRSKG